MPIHRLLAIVAILLATTAVALDAYLRFPRAGSPKASSSATILEFGPSRPWPRRADPGDAFPDDARRWVSRSPRLGEAALRLDGEPRVDPFRLGGTEFEN